MIKLEGYSVLEFSGNISCHDTTWNKTVFTSANDDTVGEVVPSSSGTPALTDFITGLATLSLGGDFDFKNLDIRYAGVGVSIDYSSGISGTVENCNISDCGTGISGGDADAVSVSAVQFCNVSTLSSGNVSLTDVTDCDGDVDNDGLPDTWELAHFGNLNQTASGDYDGDGYTNLQEHQNGTDPATADQPFKVFITSPRTGSSIP